MNYAIEFRLLNYDFLTLMPRKRALKHHFIHVEHGLVLVRLAQCEYAIEAGHSFWIPQNCLVAQTLFPNTRIQQADFSLRLKIAFPPQAGWVQPSVLFQAACERLASSNKDTELTSHLFALLKLEAAHFEPKLNQTELSQAITAWRPKHVHSLTQEQHWGLLLREAVKRRLSGEKLDTLYHSLFQLPAEQVQYMAHLILGQALQ